MYKVFTQKKNMRIQWVTIFVLIVTNALISEHALISAHPLFDTLGSHPGYRKGHIFHNNWPISMATLQLENSRRALASWSHSALIGTNMTSAAFYIKRMLGNFNQHLPIILSNNYWCQRKPTSLHDTGMGGKSLIVIWSEISFAFANNCTWLICILYKHMANHH